MSTVHSSQDPEPLHIHLDLGRMKEVARLGVRRASVFMALGVNAAEDPQLTKYSLETPMAYHFVPQGLPKAAITDMKKHFRTWIVGNGLRELIERYSIALDQFYVAVVLANDKMKRTELKRVVGEFSRRTSVSWKLSELKKLGLEPLFIDHFDSLSRLRNCLTHRGGLVGQEDCNEPGNLSVTWRSFDVVLRGDGWEANVADKIGHVLESPASVIVKPVDRQRNFPLGSAVELSPGDLSEVCMMVVQAADNIHDEVLKFARSKGVSVRAPEKKAPELTAEESRQPLPTTIEKR